MLELYIDADVLLYKFGFACETKIEWEEGVWTYTGNMRKAQSELGFLVDDVTEQLLEWSGQEECDVRMCFSSKSGSFRQLVYDGYKQSRKGRRKPQLLGDLKEWICGEYATLEEPWLEGDDVLGVYGATYSPGERTKVMCSIDKDLLTIPGHHYNWDKADKGVVSIDREQAANNFYLQTLTGDTVDDYPGCPTIGPKRGAKIIEKALEDNVPIWEAIVKTYEKHGKDELYALQMARCAYILHPNNFNIEDGAIMLWVPRRAEKTNG